MFVVFLNYIENTTGIKIPENNENQKEFQMVVDEDSTLAVDLGEINTFFENYINIAGK
jgi:hypothetical protein